MERLTWLILGGPIRIEFAFAFETKIRALAGVDGITMGLTPPNYTTPSFPR